MIAVVLAALSALVWGASDHSGGRASARSRALTVTVVSQILGLPALFVLVPALSGRPDGADLLWGAGAGTAGLLGLVLLYHGLSVGPAAVVAPVTAVTGAVVPMVVGLLTQRAPAPLALVGAGCAVVAIALVSLVPGGGGRADTRVVAIALGSGAAFGVFFSLFAQTGDDAGMWPLVTARAASVGLGGLLLAFAGTGGRPPRATYGWLVVAGFGDLLANALYLLATRDALLSVVAPIAALYPVSTVLLALTLDRERVRPLQLVGLGMAAVALVLAAS
jgi:drug/metabolite transporter (DMT)-like permease